MNDTIRKIGGTKQRCIHIPWYYFKNQHIIKDLYLSLPDECETDWICSLVKNIEKTEVIILDSHININSKAISIWEEEKVSEYIPAILWPNNKIIHKKFVLSKLKDWVMYICTLFDFQSIIIRWVDNEIEVSHTGTSHIWITDKKWVEDLFVWYQKGLYDIWPNKDWWCKPKKLTLYIPRDWIMKYLVKALLDIPYIENIEMIYIKFPFFRDTKLFKDIIVKLPNTKFWFTAFFP